MNAEELQQRLDAVAAPHGSASEGEWARNRELVGARRRRRLGVGVAAGVAAAAVAVALAWHAPTNTVHVVPASPPTTGFQESDFDAHAVDPASEEELAQQCAAVVGVGQGGYSTVFAAHSGVADAVTVKIAATGALQLCPAWRGEEVSEASELNFEAVDGGANRGTVMSLRDGSEFVSVLGYEPFPYDHVVVTSVDGQEHEAVMADGYWWAPMRNDGRASAITWRAYDANGTQIDQSDPPYSVPLVPIPTAG